MFLILLSENLFLWKVFYTKMSKQVSDMNLNSWAIRFFILIKVRTKFEESDYTMIKIRLMKNKLIYL